MSQRILRVRELLKREIGAVMEKDFDFGGALVTINDVDVTPDLKNAHVYVGSVGGGKSAGKVAVAKLNKNRAMIQKRVYSRVVLKFSARFHFKLDDSVERGVNVVSLLDDLDAESPLDPESAEWGGEEE